MSDGGVDPQLTALLEIQDLTAQLGELEAESGIADLERTTFGIDPVTAAERIRAKIIEIEDGLSAPTRSRYRRIKGVVDRAVVPVIAGVCYGCFVSIPTATAGEGDPNAQLQSCEHCGRFIYILP